MALTPDDLLSKEFPETKFRPGYDKDEVDDFLDEVVVEWRRLIQENEDLQAQVTSLEEQIEENPSNLEPDDLNDAGLSGYAGTAAEVTGTFAPITDEDEQEEQEHHEPADPAVEQPAVSAQPEYAPGTAPAQRRPEPAAVPAAAPASSGDEANSAAGVLAMAQKLHDQYVSEGEQTRAAYISEGEQKREELVDEGQTKRDDLISEGEQTREEYITEAERKRQEIVTEAETRANTMIEEAELTSSRTLSALERKKTDLEGKVTELTSFERDYRARLKDYIEGQLNDLNSRGSIEKETTGAE